MNTHCHNLSALAAAAMMITGAAAVTAAEPEVWTLEAGFEPDPRIFETRGGSVPTDDCGHVTDAPALVVDYTAGDYPLSFLAEGHGVDTTLIVVDPAGNSTCSDDAGGRNARVTFSDPGTGRYQLFPGTYESTEIGAPVEIVVTGTAEVWTLEAGFEPDPRIFETRGGSVPTDDCGHVTDAPALVVDYTAGDYPLSFLAEGHGVDTTLIVVDPAGNSTCSDDAEGRNARVTFSDPGSGRYQLFPGTYETSAIGAPVEIVVTELFGDGDPSATGFLVSDHHLVTNAHVFADTGYAMVAALGLPPFEAEVVARNEDADIALLYAADIPEGLNPVVLRSNTSLFLGEPVFVFGFPLNGDLPSGGSFTEGIVSTHLGADHEVTRFQMTAPVQPGNSGSPVFDQAGLLIGMATQTREGKTREDARPLNTVVRGSIIRAFLDNHNVDYRRSAPSPSLSSIEIGEIAADAALLLTVHGN